MHQSGGTTLCSLMGLQRRDKRAPGVTPQGGSAPGPPSSSVLPGDWELRFLSLAQNIKVGQAVGDRSESSKATGETFSAVLSKWDRRWFRHGVSGRRGLLVPCSHGPGFAHTSGRKPLASNRERSIRERGFEVPLLLPRMPASLAQGHLRTASLVNSRRGRKDSVPSSLPRASPSPETSHTTWDLFFGTAEMGQASSSFRRHARPPRCPRGHSAAPLAEQEAGHGPHTVFQKEPADTGGRGDGSARGGGARRSRQKPGREAGDRRVSEPPQGTNGLSSAAGGRRVSVISSRPPACCALFRRLQRTGREPAGEASRFRGRMPSVTLVPAPPVQLLSGHWTERDGHTGTSDRSSTGTAGRGRCSAELPRDQGARRRGPAGTSCLQGEGFAKHR